MEAGTTIIVVRIEVCQPKKSLNQDRFAACQKMGRRTGRRLQPPAVNRTSNVERRTPNALEDANGSPFEDIGALRSKLN